LFECKIFDMGLGTDYPLQTTDVDSYQGKRRVFQTPRSDPVKGAVQKTAQRLDAGIWIWLSRDTTVRQKKGRDVRAVGQLEYSEFYSA